MLTFPVTPGVVPKWWKLSKTGAPNFVEECAIGESARGAGKPGKTAFYFGHVSAGERETDSTSKERRIHREEPTRRAREGTGTSYGKWQPCSPSLKAVRVI